MTNARLDGRTALVTGASRGIGAATVVALRRLGAEVIAVSRAPFADEPDPTPAVHRVSADVGDWASVSAALGKVHADHPVIDVLVNNAGMPGKRVPVWELDPELMHTTIAVNTLGPFHLARLVLPGMVERGFGVVIVVVSGAANRPRPRRAMYGSSKAASEHLTMALAQEAADFGVRVHAFHPGPVDTALFAASRTSAEAQADLDQQLRTGTRVMQAPEEPAAALAWLASPAGAVWTDVVVPWREPEIRARIRSLPGFPQPDETK
jgi:NAD(P)-dependent dehydrogenase (short-subunit alcohol dehydrogenase family)